MLSVVCWEVVCRCVEAVMMVWGNSYGCGEAIWSVCGGFLEGVGRLSGGCEEAVWRVLDGCLEGVGRLI